MGLGPLTEDEANELQLVVEDPQTECKRIFQEAAPDAARGVVQLAKFGSNERIKLQASLHILERVLGRVQDNPTKPVDNPYREMMNEITVMLEAEAPGNGYVSNDTEVFDSSQAVRIQPGELGHLHGHTDTHNIRDIYKDME
jgi:hypothetical protein